jgi:hypothetical protein
MWKSSKVARWDGDSLDVEAGIQYETIKDPYGFIYITINYINGKRYIGQKMFDTRSRWKSYLGSGYYLNKAMKKYEKSNFKREIVAIANSSEELDELEYSWVESLNAVDSEDYYNAIDGGNYYKEITKRNSMSVVCIDNNIKFKSVAEASRFFGIPEQRIKRTFDKKHTFANYAKELPVFRRINDITCSLKFCCICGESFNEDDTVCKECKNSESYIDNKIVIVKSKHTKFTKGKNSNSKQVKCEYKYKKFAICPYCNKLFAKTNNKHTYCSDKCRILKKRNPQKIPPKIRRLNYNF